MLAIVPDGEGQLLGVFGFETGGVKNAQRIRIREHLPDAYVTRLVRGIQDWPKMDVLGDIF